jgi:hypothetical protein
MFTMPGFGQGQGFCENEIDYMLKDVSGMIGSAMPTASLICYGAGILAGRKFGLALTCKIGSLLTNMLGQTQLAERCDQASDHYWTEAKKNGIRDFTATIALIGWGLAASYAGEELIEKDRKEKSILNIFWKYTYPFSNYPKTSLIVTGLGVVYLRSMIFKSCWNRMRDRRSEIYPKMYDFPTDQQTFDRWKLETELKILKCCINCIKKDYDLHFL